MSEPRGEAMRRRLLDAVLAIAGEDGVAAVTNRRVAERAGTSPGSITYHFPSQDELLREALRAFVAAETERLRVVARRLEERPAGTAAAARDVARAVEEEATRAEQLAQLDLMLHAARDPALRDAARDCVAAYDAIASAALRALGVSDEDAARHAPLVVALLDGLALRRLATGGTGPLGTAAAIEMVVGALTARGTR